MEGESKTGQGTWGLGGDGGIFPGGSKKTEVTFLITRERA